MKNKVIGYSRYFGDTDPPKIGHIDPPWVWYSNTKDHTENGISLINSCVCFCSDRGVKACRCILILQ